ncbi:hypothetical protein Tco_0185849 [Tanacetum coccineum]
MSEAEPIPPTSSVTALRIPMIKKATPVFMMLQCKNFYGLPIKARFEEELDSAYERFQHILSMLELYDAKVSQEDANLKFLRSLPSVWHVVATMIRDKPGLDELEFDDLYNNLKLYEHELKGVSNSSSQNIAFCSTEVKGSTLKQSTTDPAHIPKGYTQAASSKVQTAPNCASHSDEIICSFFSQQASMPTTHDDEDLLQIDEDAMEEIDIRWSDLGYDGTDRTWKKMIEHGIDAEHVHLGQYGLGDFDWSNKAYGYTSVSSIGCYKTPSTLLFQWIDELAIRNKTRVPPAVLSQSTGRPYYPRLDNLRPRTSSFLPSSRSSTTRTPYRPQRPNKIMKSIWVKKGSTIGSQAVLPQNVNVKRSAMIKPTQTWRPKAIEILEYDRDKDKLSDFKEIQRSIGSLLMASQRKAICWDTLLAAKVLESITGTAKITPQKYCNTPTTTDDDVPKDGVFSTNSFDDEHTDTEEDGPPDYNNMDHTIDVSSTPTHRIHKIHPQSQIISKKLTTKINRHACLLVSYLKEEPRKSPQGLADEIWVEAMQIAEYKKLLQFKHKMYDKEGGLDECFAQLARIKQSKKKKTLFWHLHLLWALLSIRWMSKVLFVNGNITEEVLKQPPGFEDPAHPNKESAIDKTLFIKKDIKISCWFQEYVIINFGFHQVLPDGKDFEELMQKVVKMSSMVNSLSFGASSQANVRCCNKHNMIACVEKTAHNADFYQIIDYLTGCSINYSLLVDPDLIVAGKKVLISEETIRADLLFDDADGVDCFPKQVIWDSLQDIGYEGNLAQLTFSKPLFSPQWKYLVHVLLHCLSPKSTSWEQFGTNIASALVGLATNQQFNFSLMIMNGMLGHISNVTLPSKVFTFMRKHSPKFSCRITPLTPPMLEVVTALAAEEAHSTSSHSRAETSPRDAQGTPTQSAAQASLSTAEGTVDLQDTAEAQGTDDAQGTAAAQGATDTPKSPNDYTPTDASQTSGGDEGLLDLYALNREVRRLKKQTLSQAKQIHKLKAKLKKLSKFVQPVVKHHAFWVDSQNLKKRRKKQRKKHRKKVSSVQNVGENNVNNDETEERKSDETEEVLIEEEKEASDVKSPSSLIRPTQEEGSEEQFKVDEVLADISLNISRPRGLSIPGPIQSQPQQPTQATDAKR